MTAAGDVRLLRGVRWRLAAWSGGATLAIVLVLGAALYVGVANTLAANGLAQLTQRADAVRTFLSSESPDPDREAGFVFGGPSSGTFALIVGPDGAVVAPRTVLPAGVPVAKGVLAAQGGATDLQELRLGGTPVRVLSEPITGVGGRYVVQVIQDRTAEQRTLDALLLILLVGGVIGVGLAVLAGALFAGRALVPIRESLRRQREFAADASHEFRTPLAVLRASAEHLRRHEDQPVARVGNALEDIEAEVSHLTRLTDDLLLLARADSGAVDLEPRPLDLAEIALGTLPGLAQLGAERGVRTVIDPAPTPVTGDETRLRQLVRILVDNAIRHSPSGGTVTVRVHPQGSHGLLVVDDEGAGILPDHLPHLFERFWRAPDAPAGGTGLGLAIARWIAERHGGSIHAETRPTGGARFRVLLPLRNAPAPRA